MSDIIYCEIYNVISKERAILTIDKGVDRATLGKLFNEQYGREGWLIVKPLSHKGGEE